MDTSLIVRPFHWNQRDMAYGPFTISAWCLDRDSRPIHIKIQDFPVMCRLELPDYTDDGVRIGWDGIRAQKVVTWLMSELRDPPFDYEVEFRYKLQYYNDVRVPVPLLFFCQLSSLKKCEDFLRYPRYIPSVGRVKLEVLDINRDVKAHRKLLTHLDMTHCQWFRCEGQRVPPEKADSTIDEYIVNHNRIQPVDPSESESWETSPGVLVFDIEAYSHKHNAMPKPWIAEDTAYMVSVVYEQIGRPETRQKFCVTMLEARPVEDVIILRVQDEFEVAEVFARLITYLDPDLITGYNIFDFDWPYLSTRLKSRNLDWLPFGRIKDKIPKCVSRNKNYMRISGRVGIDMYQFVKPSVQLRNYKLETVAQHFLGKGKTGVTPVEMFEIYELCQRAWDEPELREKALDKATEVIEYCVMDSELVLELFIKLDVWMNLIETSNVVGVNIKDLYLRGQQVKCFSQLWNSATKNDVLVNFVEVVRGAVSGGMVLKPVTGVHDPAHCFDFSSMYPSIMEAYNICLSTLIRPEWVGDPSCNKFLQECCNYVPINEDLEGFESDDEDDPDSEKKTKKAKPPPSTEGYYFVDEKVKRGLIPDLVHNLVTERNKIKAVLKKEKDSLRRRLLNARGNALKISANSFYGVLTTKKPYRGSLACPGAGASITAMGRHGVNKMRRYLAKKYHAEIIYGDTDSVMCNFNIDDPKAAYAMGPDMAKELTTLFRAPMKLEFEKMMRIFSIGGKTYSAFLYNSNGELMTDQTLDRGGATRRREVFPWMARMFDWTVKSILLKATLEDVFDRIIDESFKFLTGGCPVEDLVIVNEVKRTSSERSKSFYIYVFAQELQRQGVPIRPGDRVEYVIVKTKDKNELVGKRMRLLDRYRDSNEELDYLYYLYNRSRTRLDRAFFEGFKPILETSYKGIGYFSKSKHSYEVSRPINMFCAMVRDSVDPCWAKSILRTDEDGKFPGYIPPDEDVE